MQRDTVVLQAALDLFEAKWEELIGMPSRKSAGDEPDVGSPDSNAQQGLLSAENKHLLKCICAWPVNVCSCGCFHSMLWFYDRFRNPTVMLLQAQQQRNKALDTAAENGKAQITGVWRQTLKGNRFQIKEAVLFNLETPTEKKVTLNLHSTAACTESFGFCADSRVSFTMKNGCQVDGVLCVQHDNQLWHGPCRLARQP
jgi:hypothetical protein